MNKYQTIVDRFVAKDVCVIGDDGIDSYHVVRARGNETSTHGAPIFTQLSPYPDTRPALASNVRTNIQSLCDDTREVLPFEFKREKIRYIDADGRCLFRVDEEDNTPIDVAKANAIMRGVRGGDNLHLLISDYNKGTVTPYLYEQLTKFETPIVVDPHPSRSLEFYLGASVISPNLSEAIAMTKLPSSISYRDLALAVRNGSGARDVVIRLGSKGCYMLDDYDVGVLVHPRPVKEVDSCGAGDTFMAALTLSLAAGANLLDACLIANYAASIAVSKPLTVRVLRSELMTALEEL